MAALDRLEGLQARGAAGRHVDMLAEEVDPGRSRSLAIAAPPVIGLR